MTIDKPTRMPEIATAASRLEGPWGEFVLSLALIAAGWLMTDSYGSR